MTEEHRRRNNDSISLTHFRSSSVLAESTHPSTLTSISSTTMASSDVQEKHDSKTAESTDATNGDLESRPRFRDIRKIVIKFWLWEIAACTLGLGSLASIVGVLIYENDKLLDQWGWSIPPTAVVSFIGTLGKASIVLVLSQVLSQMKWYHFRKTESVRNVRIFDSASRGPLGAVLVIWNSKELLACITACLMVLTILIDPFVQLVFTFPSRLVENNPGQAILYRAIEFNEASDIGYGGYCSAHKIDNGFQGFLRKIY